jgi:hypothetical protein
MSANELMIGTTMKAPTNLEEAVEYYLPRFVNMEKYFSMDEGTFSMFCHSMVSGGIGMAIRNEMGFWTKDTELYNHMKTVHNLEDANDMSDLIIVSVYRQYHNKRGTQVVLPKLNEVVLAKCRRSNGVIEYHKIRRMKTKDTDRGWQWSDAAINTYFTLEVISTEPIK